MAAHAGLKNEFMEDEKYHNLMTWLISCFFEIYRMLNERFMKTCNVYK